jgi:hypothetical protein
MNALAKALIESVAFLALSDDEVACPDDAVRALESIANSLRTASPVELTELRSALQNLITEERTNLGRPSVIKFYEDFFSNLGLPEDGAVK